MYLCVFVHESERKSWVCVCVRVCMKEKNEKETKNE